MRPTRLLILTLSIALLATAGSAFGQQDYGQGPYGDRGEERFLEHRGFEDGMVGADRDFQNHRRPDVNNRDEYRDGGRLPGWQQHEYREGFRRGYYLRVKQIYGGRQRYGYRYEDGDRD